MLVQLLTKRNLFVASLLALFASAVYLYAFPSPTIFYAAVVLLHVGVGAVVSLALIPVFARHFRAWSAIERFAWATLAAGALVGLILIYTGTPRSKWNFLYAHISFSAIACAVLAGVRFAKRASGRAPIRQSVLVLRIAASFLAIAALGIFAYEWREMRWQKINVITNSAAPTTMDGEGDGPRGDFFPSSAQTVDGKRIPGDFFMESESCKRCHADIYNQWYGSAHHFSSFNNQWYRKSIEYMQDVVGTRPSKWCGGCHDPAVLFSGLMDTPIKQIVNRPEAQAGLGCVMCHSIARVKSTMGQGDFALEYPLLHDLAASKNPIVRGFHDFVIKLNPEPHRRVFLKPFMRTQTAEFCATCHKVHLDFPVNHYRWIRGFNEYDNWQASAVSGLGARSFYYPSQPQQCADCHMPLVQSADIGNRGTIHAHSFPGANTALPYAIQDPQQLAQQEEFLKAQQVSVDIFAVAPALPKETGVLASQQELSTTFAVGEESDSERVTNERGEAAEVTAPLDRVRAVVRRGDDALVEVVVRTRKVGHFFPGGTVDAYDCWLELKATDDSGRVIFWSGSVADGGKGPVDPGAHFYRSLLVDANGNPINKRNAWAARAVVYVHLIPPGAADTVHYRLHVPSDAESHIHLQARLNYRKFSWYNTQFSFAGLPDPAQKGGEYTADFDNRSFIFTADTSGVSGNIKSVPDLPIVTMAEAQADLQIAPPGAPPPKPVQNLRAEDWTRWNDYGIGLFLQGDLRGARAAWEKIVAIDPKNFDGWTNLGRVAVQEGDLARAREVLERALALSPRLARANYFYARMLREEGKYDEAAQRLGIVLQQYPQDRVALNDLARVDLLKRDYLEALQRLARVFAIDPEDLQAHYTAMLCYQGLGDEAHVARERKLYLRFKSDEAAQSITGEYRRLHPADNNERQPIHAHVSAPLDSRPTKPAPASASLAGGS